MWNDKTVEEAIMSVMYALSLNRMPSASEIVQVTKGHALNNAIRRRGGFRMWAEKLGLELKNSETKLGNNHEYYIKDDLLDRGYTVEKMSIKHPYDLLVNNNIKIDVKASHIYNYAHGKYYSFNLEKTHHNCDIFIFVCLDENEGVVKKLIIPSKFLMGVKQISVGLQSKYDIYDNRFDYLDKFNEFYSSII